MAFWTNLQHDYNILCIRVCSMNLVMGGGGNLDNETNKSLADFVSNIAGILPHIVQFIERFPMSQTSYNTDNKATCKYAPPDNSKLL